MYQEKAKNGMGIPGWMKAVGILVIIGVIVLAIVGAVLGIRNEGVRLQNNLSTAYAGNIRTTLDTLISGAAEQMNIAGVAADAAREIGRGMLEGRYGTDGLQADNPLVISITEAYPELSVQEVASLYTEVGRYVADRRDEFAAQQRNFQLNNVQVFNNWRTTGDIFSFPIKSFLGFPTEDLYVDINRGNRVTGDSALRIMEYVISSGESSTAIDTGEVGPVIPPSNND